MRSGRVQAEDLRGFTGKLDQTRLGVGIHNAHLGGFQGKAQALLAFLQRALDFAPFERHLDRRMHFPLGKRLE